MSVWLTAVLLRPRPRTDAVALDASANTIEKTAPLKAPNTKRIAALEALKAGLSSGRIDASLKAHAKVLDAHARAMR